MQESSCAGDVEASGEDGANLPNPELARAHRAQGIAARERRDHLGAIAHFEDARKLVADDVWNTFDIAQEYRKLGRDDDALAYYRAVLAIKPDSMDAYRCMGWLESGRKRHEAALAHFRAASALAPDHHSLHVDIAGELRALGHLDEAEAECRQALAREPGLANAYRTLGIIARERKDHLGAIAHFEGARKLVADDVWNTFDIAQEYRKLGRDDDALAYYRAVLEIEPDSMDAYRCMGWLESGRRRHEAALAHFRAASALAPDHHSLHVDIAGELRALGQLDEAEAECRQALAREPGLANAYRMLGVIARERKDHLGAIAHFEDARKLVADDVWNTFDIAQEYRKLGRDDDALAYYRAVLAIKPGSVDAYRCMGWLESGRRRHEAALAHFRAASALAPDHHSLHVDIAGELRALGQLDEAEAECHQALAREPGLANAYRTLGIIARERGDHLGALRNFTAAQAFAPDSHWLFLDAAQECRSLQRYDDALEQCRISLTIAPPLPEAHRLMGFIESDRGDMIAARDHFHHALELFEAADMAMPGHFIVGIAELLLQLGDVAAAGARLEAGGSGVPSHMSADVLRLKAAVARREMDYDRELRHLQSILELLDDKTEAYLALIDRQIARGRLADAGETVRRAMLQYPQHPGLRIQQAQIFRLSGRADDCGRALLALLHSGDLSLPTRIGLAHEFRHNKMLAEARGLARSAVEIAPSSAQAWLSLVHVDLDTEGPIVALGRLQESMDIVSGHRETVLLLCRLLRETGQSEAACDFLEQGGLTWRSPASLFQEYVSCAILTGRSGKAREMLALRQLHNPGDEDDFCAELDLEMASGNSRSLEKMLARMSGRPVMRASIASRVAKIANATYNFDAVISMQASWIKLDPLHELPGMIAIAQAEFYAGREARGIAVLGDLREKFGPVPDICIVLAEFSRVAGRIEEARSILREGFAEQPDSVALFSHLVRLLIQTGALDEATSRLAAPTPPTQKWREEVSLLSMELCLERRDFRGCLEMMEAFAPSYTRDRGRYYQFAAKAALWDLDTTRLAHVLKLDSAIWQLDRKLMRQSTNMTQSLMGQLLDDFRLDVATVSTLRKARELPADQQTEALLATAGANPDSTAAALALVLHLRKAGMLEGRRRHAALIIPKRILQFWDTPKVPPDITAYMETWRRVNPGWTHELFDSSTALEFVAAKCAPDVRAAFLRARDATMKSDLFRLAWLHEGGGVYADADDVCTGPLHSVVAGGFSFVGYQEDLGSVGNNFIAVAPRHPMISLALEAACTAILRGDGDMVWLSTGPGLLSRAFATWLSSCPDLADALSETLLLERGELTAVCAPHCHASYKFTPKHWSKGIFG